MDRLSGSGRTDSTVDDSPFGSSLNTPMDEDTREPFAAIGEKLKEIEAKKSEQPTHFVSLLLLYLTTVLIEIFGKDRLTLKYKNSPLFKIISKSMEIKTTLFKLYSRKTPTYPSPVYLTPPPVSFLRSPRCLSPLQKLPTVKSFLLLLFLIRRESFLVRYKTLNSHFLLNILLRSSRPVQAFKVLVASKTIQCSTRLSPNTISMLIRARR